MEHDTRRIERFDPILRNLLAWDLVTKEGSEGEESWRLVPDAEQRLSQLARSSTPPDIRKVVYLDHRCADCQQRRPTRPQGAVFLCDACRELRRAPARAKAPAQAVVATPRRRPLSRSR